MMKRTPSLTVDVGCGSGQNTELLASLGTRVLGLDVSPAQIEEATQAKHADNITYVIGRAESLPVDNQSVSLLTAFVSAHWFDVPAFMCECKRVLEPGGCLAVYSYMYPFAVDCGDFSQKLTQILWKVIEDLRPYESDKMKDVREDYTAMFQAIPFADKTRIENMQRITTVKMPDFTGFITSFAEYQALKREYPDDAKTMMEAIEQSVKETLGDAVASAEIHIVTKTVLLLACNAASHP